MKIINITLYLATIVFFNFSQGEYVDMNNEMHEITTQDIAIEITENGEYALGVGVSKKYYDEYLYDYINSRELGAHGGLPLYGEINVYLEPNNVLVKKINLERGYSLVKSEFLGEYLFKDSGFAFKLKKGRYVIKSRIMVPDYIPNNIKIMISIIKQGKFLK